MAIAGARSEVTITRRLFRSGDSEYLINGRPPGCATFRTSLWAPASGPESYAIIEQGRIGQILSNKPADRRAVIEEAAGITKFKTRKRLAEAKLEGAKQNLSRVFDILEEVGRQVQFAQAPGVQGPPLRGTADRDDRAPQGRAHGTYRMLEREAAKLALDLNQAAGQYQEIVAGSSDQRRRPDPPARTAMPPRRS